MTTTPGPGAQKPVGSSVERVGAGSVHVSTWTVLFTDSLHRLRCGRAGAEDAFDGVRSEHDESTYEAIATGPSSSAPATG